MLDEEGFCTILDREADMLIRGGENIYCIEVENVLVQHPAVADAALVGLPHPLLGEVPAAAGADAARRQGQRRRAAGFCRRAAGGLQGAGASCGCREAALPRNEAGKLVKQDLRKVFEA